MENYSLTKNGDLPRTTPILKFLFPTDGKCKIRNRVKKVDFVQEKFSLR